MTVNETDDKKIEVYEEKADIAAPQLDDDQIKAAALAYARYLKDKGLKPGEATFVEPSDIGVDLDGLSKSEEAKRDEAHDEAKEEASYEALEKAAEAAEKAGSDDKDAETASDEEDAKAGSDEAEAKEDCGAGAGSDGDPEPEESSKDDGSADKTTAGEGSEKNRDNKDEPAEKRKERDLKRIRAREEAKRKSEAKFMAGGKKTALASVTDIHDKAQDGIDRVVLNIGKDIVKGAHRITSTYRNSRKVIGLAILISGLLAAAILIIFDKYTIYEYAYNGKILGYVHEQEEVTDVLDVAARNLSKNNNGAGVQFVANQNITFNLVDARGRSTDDSDTVVNKLIYMTDIETEAYAVYDGDKVVAVLKDEDDAETLLVQTQDELSTPDKGMKLVSSEFVNELSIKPVNVLLGSIKSNAAAKDLMINGGDMYTYHIAEAGETVESLAQEFGVDVSSIYDENNKNVVTEIEQGDKVCIRSTVEPVSVKMVEKGSIKEVIEYETIKEETDELYKGDTDLKQDGQNGVQIFTGTITKVGGVETARKQSEESEILQKKIDKIILVGTAERPKTAATGTFIMPINTYVVTSEFGGRWGRMHEGMDFGASTGTPIYASDGGKVTRAGYYSGYGLCVDVDHGNGVFTRYGHCSAVYVSVGDLVYQGQHIAAVGSTGYSTGPHLHFEVRVNGVAQNPRNYVNP